MQRLIQHLLQLPILGVPASSVPCEHLFSAGKLIATDCHSRLGSDHFKELQIMRSAWKEDVVNWATLNTGDVEEVQIHDFETLLSDNIAASAWNDEMGIGD